MTDAGSKIDVRRLKVGHLLIKILVHCALLGLVFPVLGQSGVISVPVAWQWRHPERIQCV